MEGTDWASKVTCKKDYVFSDSVEVEWVEDEKPAASKHNVVVMDFGVKKNILRELVSAGCKVTVVPAGTSAKTILDMKPDGIMMVSLILRITLQKLLLQKNQKRLGSLWVS